MNRIDWTVLALSVPQGRPISPAHLQQSLFLFEQAFPPASPAWSYEFVPGDYGPESVEVYHDIDDLADSGLIIVSQGRGGWQEYAVTPAGLQRAADLSASAPTAAAAYLREVVQWAMGQNLQQLIRAIRDRFPSFHEHSLVGCNQ